MAVGEYRFRLIVDSRRATAEAKRFRGVWQKELGALGRPGPGSAVGNFNQMLGTMAGGLGLALGAREMVNFTAESMEMARAQADARNALITTVGSAGQYQKAIAQARETTRNMVSEQELAVGINAMMSMQLASSTEEAAQLSMAGSVLSKVYAGAGASMEKYYRLLAGGSPVLYDNFGLTREMVAARQEEIVAATGVSEAEAKLRAIRELSLEAANRYNQALSDETVQAAQAKAAADDLKAAWGEVVNSLLYDAGTVEALTTALRSLEAVMEGNDSAFRQQANNILAASESYAEYSRAMVQSGLQAQKLSREQFESVKAAVAATEASGEYEHEAHRMGMTLAALEGQQRASTTASQDQALWLSTVTDIQARVGDEYLTSAKNLEVYVNELARASMYGGMSAPALTNLYGPQEDTSFLDQLAMDRARQRRLERERESAEERQAADETTRIWQQSMEQANDRLRSLVEGAIQPTLHEVWKPPEDDRRIDEWARRLATVATSGFDSAWLEELNAQFGGMSFWEPIAQAMASGDEGALKQAAAQLLAGPGVTQLWDKELIKQRIREDLARQNAQEEIIQTIMQELSAEGFQVGAGDVQMAMGVSPVVNMMLGDPAQMGTQLQSGLSTALAGTTIDPAIFEASPIGQQVAGAMATAISGGLSGVQWAEMLATAIEDDLGGKMESVIQPIVVPVGRTLGTYLAQGAAESDFAQTIIAAVMEQLADAVGGGEGA